jgi:hypothetical protein
MPTYNPFVPRLLKLMGESEYIYTLGEEYYIVLKFKPTQPNYIVTFISKINGMKMIGKS